MRELLDADAGAVPESHSSGESLGDDDIASCARALRWLRDPSPVTRPTSIRRLTLAADAIGRVSRSASDEDAGAFLRSTSEWMGALAMELRTPSALRCRNEDVQALAVALVPILAAHVRTVTEQPARGQRGRRIMYPSVGELTARHGTQEWCGALIQAAGQVGVEISTLIAKVPPSHRTAVAAALRNMRRRKDVRCRRGRWVWDAR